MRRAIAAAFLLAAGCSAGPAGGDGGAADAPPGADAPLGAGGLTFQLVARPALAHVAANVDVNEIRFWLRDIRAIGDAAPGDARTSLAEAQLDYRTDRDPDPIPFPLAPPGLYSELEARLGQVGGGGGNGYEIRGTVSVGGTTYELEINDESASGTITVPLGGLRVDNQTIATVALDLSFLGAIDWAAAGHDQDRIALDSSSPTTAQVRAGMLVAFRLE
jgi:hypothetical protein